MGISINPRLERILKSSHADGRSFTNVLTSLDLLEKKDGCFNTEKKNLSYTNKHARYKKVLDTPQSKQVEDDPNNDLKKFSTQLLKRIITPDQFREVLRDNGINPMVEGINKVVRDHEVGKFVKFNELFGAVVKHKKDKFDPTQINFEIKTKQFYKESANEQNGSKSMVPMNNGTGQLIYFSQKKPISCKFNSFQSNKDIFDWDLSTLNKLKSGELNPPNCSKNDPKQKTLFQSNIFNDTPVFESPNKKQRPSTAFLGGSGDIFTWKGSNSESKAQNDIRRRNPNEKLINQDAVERKPVKINKMLFSSVENSLNTKA